MSLFQITNCTGVFISLGDSDRQLLCQKLQVGKAEVSQVRIKPQEHIAITIIIVIAQVWNNAILDY